LATFKDQLKLIKSEGYLRERDRISLTSSSHIKIQDRLVTSFSSNDYLGMSTNKDIISALKKSASEYGIGSGSSPLISGYTESHHYLEKEICEYLNTESCIIVNSGYMANLCLLSIFDKEVNVIQDKESHNSIVESSKLNKIKIHRYPHLDDSQIIKHISKDNDILFSEAVFSMTGDITDLKNHLTIKKKFKTKLYIDDAHGFAVAEKSGDNTSIETSCGIFGMKPSDADAYMGTFGKAVGTIGAFICGNKDLVEMIVQKGRPYIYSTSLPRCMIDATRKSLNILAVDKSRYIKLHENITYFNNSCKRKKIPVNLNQVPIKTVLLGNPHLTLKVKETFLKENILIQAIRYPTVPKNNDKIRITLTATHTKKDIDNLLNTLENVICEKHT
tara:strand:- start:1059 stop:2225 length:1167 start_codon:yes stop_codon:yes gene_type:complete